MKKKVMSIMLCIVSIFTLAVPGLASADNSAKEIDSMSAKYSLETEFSSIRKTADGEYAMTMDSNDELIPVGRLDIELDNEEQVNMVLAMDNLEEDTKQYIQELSEKAQNDPENDGAVITLFSQDLLQQTMASSTTYYTYNGMSMKSDKVYIYNNPSGYKYLAQGARTKAVADTIEEMFLYAVGSVSTIISFGTTLLNIFEALAGQNVATASSSDFVQINVTYDGVTQLTYVQADGYWWHGCTSQHITLNTVEIYQKYMLNGRAQEYRYYQYPLCGYMSDTFLSPWSAAFSYYQFGGLYDWVTAEAGGITWYFD